MDTLLAKRLSRYLSPAQSELLTAPDGAVLRAALRSLLEVVSTYLPRHVIRTELQNLDRSIDPIGGEFLRGALAFADISGFTALSEKLSVMGREGAEQVTDIVNRYFRRMLGIVFEYGGDVFKFGGDALLIYFPDNVQLGAVAALTASWHMQQAMTELAEVKTTLGTFPLRMKIGLNAGAFFTGRLGTPADRQFMVAGDNVNATARAESQSVAGQILVTPTVYAALSGPASPFQFAPGLNDHYLLTALRDQPDIAPLPWPKPLLPADAALDSIVTALDRLTPFLPAGLLPRLIGDPTQQHAVGEHRLVGTLFCNFFGASDLIGRLGLDRADEIAAHLNRYLIKMHTAIAQYGGVISKIDLYDHGDKIMAVFGAPIAHENDAERALRAGLGMQTVVRDVLPMMKIEQSIGVTSGVAFAGLVGSDERREYTVMGDDVNLAARLMSAAQPGELLLSSSIRRKVTAFFDVADRGTVKVKGKSQPIPIFSVVGPRAQPEPVRGIRGLHSPLVGRETELATLREVAAQVRSGTGQILVMTGDAGLGKSRLIDEVRAHIATADGLCLESHCLSYTQNVSYSAFTDIVHSALGLSAGDSEVEGWARLRQRLADLLTVDVSDDIVPYLASFLSWHLPEALAERVAYLEGEALQRQVIRAVVTLLDALAARQPLLLIFDDLHWADSASLAMLDRTLTLVERTPILIAALYRPDRAHGSWTLGEAAARAYPAHGVSVRVPPLDVSRGEDQQLVRNLLQWDQLPIELPPLIARAEGNPFYIEEIIRALIDAGAIVFQTDRWQPTRSLGLSTVPDSLQGIIMARIDRLIEDARRTLQLASVVGRTFRYLALNWLASAAQAALAAQLDGSLSTLQRAELIREQTRLPELEYGFAQAMFRDVAYESLLLRDRRLYHQLVAQQLEETHPDQIEEVVELLAHHYGLSDDRRKALTYLIKAGDKTRSAYANKEAIEFYTQAALLADHLGTPADSAASAEGLGDVFYHVGQYEDALACFTRALSFRADPLQLADLYRRMGAVYEKRGEYEAALTHCASGLNLLRAEHTGSVERARLLTLECRVHHQQGQFEQAIEDGEQALAIIDDTAHYQEIAQAHNQLGNAYLLCGQSEAAIRHFERGLLMLERIGDEHGASRIYNNLAIVHSQTDLGLSLTYMQRVLDTMQRLGDIWGVSTAYQNLGIVHFSRGDYVRATEHYQRSLQLKERLNDSAGIADCYINLGEVARTQGNLAQAIAHLEKSLAIANELRADQTIAEAYRQLTECYLDNRQIDRAAAACEAALRYARQIGDRNREGIAHRLYGKVSHRQGELNLALEHLQHSLAILRELNSEIDLAWACYDYGLIMAAAGAPAAARDQLLEARDIFARLQLPQEQAKAQTALDQLPPDLAAIH